MNPDENPPVNDEADPLLEPNRAQGEELLRHIDEDAEDVPYISAAMLHHERIDFEAGMSAIPPVTLSLMAACVAVYVRQVLIGGLNNPMRVVETGAMSRDEVLKGEVWRLISAGFLHANSEHLVGNLIMLFILGMACEHAFGRGAFMFLYVATCVTGSLLTMIRPTPTVGASGAIFGLAGAILSTIVAHRHRIELRDHRVAIVLAVWATYTLVLGLFNPIVSNVDHLGGLLGGLILGWCLPAAMLTDRRALAAQPVNRLLTTIAVAALLVTAIFFLPHLV
jgi:rhomboid protease GluP